MSVLADLPHLKTIRDIAKRRRLEVYLVGGFLRDFMLGKPCFDFDFAVDKEAISLAKKFSDTIKGAFVLLDDEHGCARVVKKQKRQIYTFDFADYRANTIKKDLLHRDFTINTFCLNVNEMKNETTVEDAFQDFRKGLPDLRAKRIKMASDKAFKKDPLRLLRAFSLRAIFDFKIEQDTQKQIKEDRDLIADVSSERIREELFKILETERAASNLKAMDRFGLLSRIMPQISIMFDVKQGTYHHLDVWPHSLETVVQLEKLIMEWRDDTDITEYLNETIAGQHTRSALMKLGALLHDIGKPETRRREKSRISFHGHERVGKGITRSIARDLKLSTKERLALEDMVLWHLRPGYLSNFKRPSERAIFRYLRDTKEEAVSIALLALADQRATRGPATTEQDITHHTKICQDVISRYFIKKKEKPFVRLINGDDLIENFNLHPSPLFKKILDAVEENQVTLRIRTKREALALAAKIAKKG